MNPPPPPASHDDPPTDEELLAAFALGDWTSEELERLADADRADLHRLDEIATATLLGLHERSGVLPPTLRDRLLADAAPHVRHRKRPAGQAMSLTTAAPWIAAVLACAFAAAVLLPQAARIDDPAAARRRFLAATGARPLAWSAGNVGALAAVSGDVVWDDARQQGFLRFRGLPANDPEQSQYQLWIADPDRDTHPVDGGVFDVPSGSMPWDSGAGTNSAVTVVPFRPALPVEHPTLFAVTVEQPGGVVVSDQQRLAAVAPVP